MAAAKSMGPATAITLSGRNVLITGGSRGLGRAMVKEFGAGGANVLFCSQSEKQLVATCEELKSSFPPPQKLAAQVCDISNEKEVGQLFEKLANEFGSLYGVINNAGVQEPIGFFEKVDWHAWRRTIEINLLGTALVCRHAIPILKANGCGKIVNLSGGGAAGPRARFSAYAASKAAVVRMTETLAEELRDFHIDVNAVAPGPLNTRLLDEVIAAGADNAGAQNYAQALQQRTEGGYPIDDAARLCVYLASPASDGITGKLISAQWDPWSELQKHRELLQSSDIYTLRRIVPKDRGYDW
jgi:NAD(P)-dependent dehydrogenase (short-subunit alcohol dehydrogenase family)